MNYKDILLSLKNLNKKVNEERRVTNNMYFELTVFINTVNRTHKFVHRQSISIFADALVTSVLPKLGIDHDYFLSEDLINKNDYPEHFSLIMNDDKTIRVIDTYYIADITYVLKSYKDERERTK